MCKFNPKNDSRRIDPCMKNFIGILELLLEDGPFRIVACCCGHRKYPMTVVIKNAVNGTVIEIFGSHIIEREKRFYKKDKQGYYYIPEVIA